MKVLQFILSLLIIFQISGADDDVDSLPMKRPFCNAFTGCGKKRDPAYAAAPVGGYNPNEIQMAVPLYRALLRFAGIRNNILNNNNNNINNNGLPGPLVQPMRQRLDGEEQLPLPRLGPY